MLGFNLMLDREFYTSNSIYTSKTSRTDRTWPNNLVTHQELLSLTTGVGKVAEGNSCFRAQG